MARPKECQPVRYSMEPEASPVVSRIRVAVSILLSAAVLQAEDFNLKFFGDGPLHSDLTYEGKGERITATAINKSGTTIQRAKICIESPDVKPCCLFELWNTAEWAPGAEVTWTKATDRKVSALTHQASLDEFQAVGPPSAASSSSIPSPNAGAPVAPPRPKHNWQFGTVLDSQSARTYVQTGSSTQAQGTSVTSGLSSESGSATTVGGTTSFSGSGSVNATTRSRESSETQIHSMTLQETELMIVNKDFLFVVSDVAEKGSGLYGSLGRAIYNRKHGCHIIVNDPVDFYQEKTTVYVLDVDGKECKMDLIRQERVVKPVSPASADGK